MNRYLISLVLAGLTVFLIVMAVWGDHGYLHLLKMRERISRIEQETARVKRENRRLQKKVFLLQSDPRCQEMTVRQELKMIRPNEQIFVFRQP